MAGRVFRYRIHGDATLRRNLRLLNGNAPQAGKLALLEEAEATMTASKGEVPVDKGVLRSTGHVAPPVVRGRAITVQAAYGGPAAPYAARQHNELGYRHTVGKAMFLRDPFEARLPGMPERIGARMGGILIGGLP